MDACVFSRMNYQNLGVTEKYPYNSHGLYNIWKIFLENACL